MPLARGGQSPAGLGHDGLVADGARACARRSAAVLFRRAPESFGGELSLRALQVGQQVEHEGGVDPRVAMIADGIDFPAFEVVRQRPFQMARATIDFPPSLVDRTRDPKRFLIASVAQRVVWVGVQESEAPR